MLGTGPRFQLRPGVRSTCQKPLRLSIFVLERQEAIFSRVEFMIGIDPEWFSVFLFSSPYSTTSRLAVDPGLATRKQGLQCLGSPHPCTPGLGQR